VEVPAADPARVPGARFAGAGRALRAACSRRAERPRAHSTGTRVGVAGNRRRELAVARTGPLAGADRPAGGGRSRLAQLERANRPVGGRRDLPGGVPPAARHGPLGAGAVGAFRCPPGRRGEGAARPRRGVEPDHELGGPGRADAGGTGRPAPPAYRRFRRAPRPGGRLPVMAGSPAGRCALGHARRGPGRIPAGVPR